MYTKTNAQMKKTSVMPWNHKKMDSGAYNPTKPAIKS